MLKRDIHDVPMGILLTADHRRMLEWLAGHQYRTMADVIRVAIMRIYQAETAGRGEHGRAGQGLGQ